MRSGWSVVAVAVLACAAGVGGTTTESAAGSAAAARDRPIVRQDAIGAYSCGFCALYHSLAWGGKELAAAATKLAGKSDADKVEQLIARYGAKPSEAYGAKRARYVASSGITWSDLGVATGELFADAGLGKVVSGYLDRQQDELHPAQARRIHRLLADSLAAGMPPLLSIRSFSVREVDGKKQWQSVLGHWVTVVDVQPELGDGEQGFRLGFVDSETGRLQWGYAFADDTRWFKAVKGDAEKWEWLADSPFLVLAAPKPGLATGDEPWSTRTVVTLNYAIGRAKK
jgi:hypothetical protein